MINDRCLELQKKKKKKGLLMLINEITNRKKYAHVMVQFQTFILHMRIYTNNKLVQGISIVALPPYELHDIFSSLNLLYTFYSVAMVGTT